MHHVRVPWRMVSRDHRKWLDGWQMKVGVTKPMTDQERIRYSISKTDWLGARPARAGYGNNSQSLASGVFLRTVGMGDGAARGVSLSLKSSS